MVRSDLLDMYTWTQEQAALEGECTHIRQITTAKIHNVMIVTLQEH